MSRIRKEGKIEYRFEHPDEFREFVRDRKARKPAEKLVEAARGGSWSERVTVIAGTCVAYASVVGTEGSNQFIAAVPTPKS